MLKGISHNDRNMGKEVTELESSLVTAHEVNNNINKMGGEGTAEFTHRAIQIYCG